MKPIIKQDEKYNNERIKPVDEYLVHNPKAKSGELVIPTTGVNMTYLSELISSFDVKYRLRISELTLNFCLSLAARKCAIFT